MQTKDTNPLSDSTLAKLLEVDSGLAAQEAKLVTQLQQLQEKRRSLKTVVSLFTPEETTAAPADTPGAASPPTLAAAEEQTPQPSLPGETSPEMEPHSRSLIELEVLPTTFAKKSAKDLSAAVLDPNLTLEGVARNFDESLFSKYLLFCDGKLSWLESSKFREKIVELSGKNKGQLVFKAVHPIGEALRELKQEAEHYQVLDADYPLQKRTL